MLATVAASPSSKLPVPPIPPAHPPLGQSAPVPNSNATAPLVAPTNGAQVSVSNFRYNRFDRSLGYTPGSSYQTGEEKRGIQTPGLTLRVPLQ
jgi:hypothetical protein